MTSCFSLPWFLVVVFAILSILIAIMWFCEHVEKEYFQNKRYSEIDDRLFFNDYLYKENQLLYDELMEYKRIAYKYRCLNAKELENILNELCRKEKT